MSKLTDIKSRINQMDGGAFQNLCDAYLSYKGYKNAYSLGMYTGTDTIEKYSYDGERMYQLFSAIEELPCERRKKAVEKFLSLNADPDIFERLPLEPSHWGGNGSMIPDMQERIEYLRSLLPLVSGIKYLKQKQRIEREIGCWKERIHSEEVRELLESWYC